MAEYLTHEARLLGEGHPLVRYAMSEAHPEDTARIIAEEEFAVSELIGAVPCPDALPHGHGRAGDVPFSDACPSCGAVT